MNASRTSLLFSLSLAACSDSGDVRSGAQLLEVETTIQNGSSTNIERVAMSYEGAQLREIARFENGAPAGTARPTYGAGGIVSVEYADDEGDRATEQLAYEAGKLARARYEIPGIRVDERTISYDAAHAGALKEVSTLTTSPGQTSTTMLRRYEYDTSGRTTKQLDIAGTQTSSVELRYAPDGSLERASLFEGGETRETFTFTLVDGRLDEVLDSRNGRHEVSYDDAGRISEIRHSTSSGTSTSRYTYGDGSVSGWTFAPAVPVAQLFDLDGVGYNTVSLLHGDIAIPRDLPRATGPGPGPGPGPTCGIEPVDACETCLVANCCSEVEACLIGSPCDDYYQCMVNCTDAQCQTVCGETNPTGRSDFESVQSCGQAFCPSSCGA